MNFYRDIFAFESITEHVRDDGSAIVHLQAPGQKAILEIVEVGCVSPGDHVHLGFSTHSLDEILERLVELSIPIERGPLAIGTERILFIRDPDGYLIEINEGL